MALISNGDIIISPQTVTGTWVDLGLEIETLNYSFFSTYIELDINDSKDIQFRYRSLYEPGGLEYIIPFQTLKKDRVLVDDYFFEIDNDADQNIIIPIEMGQTFPIIKIQAQAGTVGAIAGIITTARYVQGYRQ